VVAGFTDGTLRLFELNGTFIQHKMPPGNDSSTEDDDDDEEEAIFDIISTKSTMVCSKTYQRYGAVACQIHAKGVHTSLIMKVDVSPDGLYAFGGVARGSMELVAVDLSKLQDQTGDILDHISVETHSDAKLRGFGACTRLKGTNKYLLLTGKGIKNIHIWAFSPLSKNHKWECLYDTQTNGNTITFLHFRYHTSGHLQALSKSDGQKVRVWDLQHEQQRHNKDVRPKRPPFTDIPSTESALGIAGNFCLGGCHSITLVNLDILESTMNFTELPLPGSNIRRVGRQQRGELQTLQSVVCLSMDGSHALLEMSDVSKNIQSLIQKHSVWQLTLHLQ
jgi:WD40 repeat protein